MSRYVWPNFKNQQSVDPCQITNQKRIVSLPTLSHLCPLVHNLVQFRFKNGFDTKICNVKKCYFVTQKAGPSCNKLSMNENQRMEIKKYFHTCSLVHNLVQFRCQKTVCTSCTQNISSTKMLNYCKTQNAALNSAGFKILAALEAGT